MYKVVVYVPVQDAGKMRHVIGEADGGKIGKYSFCSFSIRGVGRFKPEKGARPTIGEVGKLEEVEEERIEFVCSENAVQGILAAIRATHPYEEPAIDIIELADVK